MRDLRIVVADISVRRHGRAIPAEDAAFLAADVAWRWRWSGIAA